MQDKIPAAIDTAAAHFTFKLGPASFPASAAGSTDNLLEQFDPKNHDTNHDTALRYIRGISFSYSAIT
jgi:hypothetical protein